MNPTHISAYFHITFIDIHIISYELFNIIYIAIYIYIYICVYISADSHESKMLQTFLLHQGPWDTPALYRKRPWPKAAVRWVLGTLGEAGAGRPGVPDTIEHGEHPPKNTGIFMALFSLPSGYLA